MSKITVAPHAGAWIEIDVFECGAIAISVAPHAGAWIEILLCVTLKQNLLSRPSRRGVD